MNLPTKFGWLGRSPKDPRDYTYANLKERNKGLFDILNDIFNGNMSEQIKCPNNDRYAPVGRLQGNLGSCVAHAIPNALQFLQNRTQGESIKGSRLFFYYVIRWLLEYKNPHEDNGSFLRTGLKAAAAIGIPPEESYPYILANYNYPPNPILYSLADDFTAISYINLDPKGRPKKKVLKDMMTWCDLGFPLVFGTWLYNRTYRKSFETGIIECPRKTDLFIGGHALYCPAGYNDNCIRIGNSHEDWGDEKHLGWFTFDNILNGYVEDIWVITGIKYLNLKQFGE